MKTGGFVFDPLAVGQLSACKYSVDGNAGRKTGYLLRSGYSLKLWPFCDMLMSEPFKQIQILDFNDAAEITVAEYI